MHQPIWKIRVSRTVVREPNKRAERAEAELSRLRAEAERMRADAQKAISEDETNATVAEEPEAGEDNDA
jgi:hypothetical protein